MREEREKMSVHKKDPSIQTSDDKKSIISVSSKQSDVRAKIVQVGDDHVMNIEAKVIPKAVKQYECVGIVFF